MTTISLTDLAAVTGGVRTSTRTQVRTPAPKAAAPVAPAPVAPAPVKAAPSVSDALSDFARREPFGYSNMMHGGDI